MPQYTDPTDSIAAQITNTGQIALARAALGDISFVFDSYAVGRGGYTVFNPVHINPINGGANFLDDQIFPLPTPVNAKQLIDFNLVPTAGGWQVAYNGNPTTVLAFNATASQVQTAINLLPGLGGVLVIGNYTSGFTCEFAGLNGGQHQPKMTVFSNSLQSGVLPVAMGINTIQEGFPVTLQPFDGIEQPNIKATAVTCRLAQNMGNYGLGEIGLWCRIINSIIPDEIGTKFLFMLAHMPIQSKTDRHIYVYRFVTQF